MRHQFLAALALCGILASGVPASLSAQQAVETAEATTPVKVEGYYRIKWGSFDEFFALYQKNHLPLLERAKAEGIITDIRIEVPFTHMAGEERWDLRVAITYRDAAAALVIDPAFISLFDDAAASLKSANPDFDDEEARRFALLDEHWDVVVLRAN